MLSDNWTGARHVLVVLIDDIKEVIMAGPALRALRQTLPAAKITLLTSASGSRVSPLLPWLDAVLITPADWPEALLPISGYEPALVETIKARQFDAAVILTGFNQSPYPAGYICYLAGIPIRLGQSREFGGGILSQTVKPYPDTLSLADHYLNLLEAAGFPLAGRYLELHLPGPLQSAADNILRQVQIDPRTPLAVLAFGFAGTSRRAKPESYLATVRMLMARATMPLVLLGSRWDDESIKPVLNIARDYPLVSLCGQTSVAEYAAIINRAKLVIANDPDAISIAYALQRPLVTLSASPVPVPGPLEERITLPWLSPAAGEPGVEGKAGAPLSFPSRRRTF